MKIKKFIIAVIIGIIAILGISTQSNAYSSSANYKVGQTVWITFQNMKDDLNLLCMEYKDYMKNSGAPYKVVSVIDIDGTKSTDQTGKTIDSIYNARMAYIAASSTDFVSTSTTDSTIKQLGMWTFGWKWMKEVGKYHVGLNSNFARSGTKRSMLVQESINYANSIKDSNLEVKDNTKKAKIKKDIITIDKKSYIKVGPFNLTFPGSLKNVNIYNQDNKKISNILFGTYKGTKFEKKEVKDIKSDKNFYILIPENSGTTKMVKMTATASVNIIKAKLTFFKSSYGSWQNLVRATGTSQPKNIQSEMNYDIPFVANLKIIKVDENNKAIKLNNVEFIIQNNDNGKYVKRDASGNITFVEKDKNPTTFVTKNGEILIENLPYGTYTAYETKNPNYGYRILDNGVDTKLSPIDKTKELQITNKQELIKISGYVWNDEPSQKQSIRNDLYKEIVNGDPEVDNKDYLISGVTVRLKDKSGNIVKNGEGKEFVTTTVNGKYIFEDVLISELDNYYVEFEYDGLIYTNVVPHLDKDNGSKAIESATNRDNLNNQFARIEGTGENTGVSKDANGNVTHNLTYEKDKANHTSKFINDGSYQLTADTREANFNLKDKYKEGVTEIENINLGLYEREQPDLALGEDIENVKLTINGFAHVYKYANRIDNSGEYKEEEFNVGVRFGQNRENMPYSRAVYQSDLDYITEDKDNELKAYITYRIAIKNQSGLNEKVNTFVDYYDSRYTLVNVGTGLDENTANITGELQHTPEESYSADYNKTTITLDNYIGSYKSFNVYMQFKLEREAVLEIINNKELLDNVAEITSYSVQDKNGKFYAGIDSDSNPMNVIPGDEDSMEDDSICAPSLLLEIADARQMTGIVFLDTTDGALATAQIREGDGEYKEGEKGIKDVDIRLTEKSSGIEYTTKTDENGEFIINGFIPGNYTLTYTWGNEEYKVEDFKGTIYNDKDRMNNPEWYKKDVDTRYSDAIDNWDIRAQIDKIDTNVTKMDSSTPDMKIGIEYDTTYSAPLEDKLSYGISKGDKFIYQIKNIDFGIVERARQELTLVKTVKGLKITLENGETLVDAKINDEGKLEGQIAGVTGGPSYNFIKAELDKELIQSSTLQIDYEIKVKNISENDYVSEDGYYYNYGYKQATDNNKLGSTLQLNIGEVSDYLDSTIAFSEKEENIWNVRENEDNQKILLVTNKLSEKSLSPNEESTVELQASKILTSQEDSTFNNEAKITKVSRTPEVTTGTPYGRKPNMPEDTAEQVIITSPTGMNLNYMPIIIIGISTLVILGAGVIVIRKKILK